MESYRVCFSWGWLFLFFDHSVMSNSLQAHGPHQASLSITNSRSILKLMSIASVMPSNHLILCHPLISPVFSLSQHRVFPKESVLCIGLPKYWSFSFSISFLLMDIQD